MSRTPARFTQADVARAIRATKQAGGGAVELLPAEGIIRINLTGERAHSVELVETEEEIVL